jgi:ElaB/YqjD/DUF883 family membrane-anchored ribosome-binding protein
MHGGWRAGWPVAGIASGMEIARACGRFSDFEEARMRYTLFGSGSARHADKVVTGLSEMAAKAQDLLREVSSDVGDRVDDTTSRLADAGAKVSDRARYAIGATDEYVRENPWKVLGVGVALGAILAAMLLSRRDM